MYARSLIFLEHGDISGIEEHLQNIGYREITCRGQEV